MTQLLGEYNRFLLDGVVWLRLVGVANAGSPCGDDGTEKL